MIGYCLKCRKKTEMLNPKRKTLKKGRQAMQGICSECKTQKMTVFVAKENKLKKNKSNKKSKKNKSQKK